MIRVPSAALPVETVAQLSKYQAQVDAAMTFTERAEVAQRKFAQYNRRTNRVFSVVRKTLGAMCSGANRCMYCEDSVADEVEHHHPKQLFPELVFVWQNYLYACGSCNGPKRDRFAVLTRAGRLFHLSPTPAGVRAKSNQAALLNPRKDDARDFMILDIHGRTFYFVPTGRPGTAARKRAEYTIDLLGLNERDHLPRARREAYFSYRARLKEYVQTREKGANGKELHRLTDAIRSMQHPTVWVEMKRQSRQIPELRQLFRQAPEARGW